MKKMMLALLTTLMLLAAGTAMAGNDGWQVFRANDYGYAMLVPDGTLMETKQFGGGWGGMRGISDGVAVVGVAKLGPAETAAEIERFGVEVTKIPFNAWNVIDSGSGNGWNWYKTVTARSGNKLFFGGYGVGARGSYLILLETTASDFDAHRSDYDTWYHSISLF